MCADMERWSRYVDTWKMHCKTLWTIWSHFCSKWVVSKCIAKIKFTKVVIYINFYGSYLWGVGLWGTSTFCITFLYVEFYIMNLYKSYNKIKQEGGKRPSRICWELFSPIKPSQAGLARALTWPYVIRGVLQQSWVENEVLELEAYFPTDFHYWMRSYVPVEKILQRLSW